MRKLYQSVGAIGLAGLLSMVNTATAQAEATATEPGIDDGTVLNSEENGEDNVMQSIPEPTALLLGAPQGLALLIMRKRRT